MNQVALEKTIASKLVTFYSRTRNSLWQKGETSGNVLKLCHISIDCDNDTLLIQAKPQGATCHKGTTSCFPDAPTTPWAIIATLEKTIAERANNNSETSYTNTLLKSGLARVSQKIGEEAVEVVIAALAETNKFREEVADLCYHLLVLLKAKNIKLAEIGAVLQGRMTRSKQPN